MRRIVALFLTVLLGGVSIVVMASPVSAATITTPTGDPFVVSADGAGNPQPFTVSASGYTPGGNVFIEQCDGTPPTAVGWDPTTNCDLGASPAPVIADANGVVTFPAGDPNFSFHPFRGASPQGLFNCLAPGQASPANGLPDFTSCQFRVASNNSASTSDQAFRTMTLPAGQASTPPGFTGTPGSGTQNTAYSFAFTGITGSPAPTFTMSPQTVAGGITINAAGTLSGTPTAAGSFPITVTATNGVQPDAVKQLTLQIAAAGVAPGFAGTPSNATQSSAYSFSFTNITGTPAPTFAMSPTTVAGGITISAAGALSGTPTAAGSFPITVTASNGVAPNAVKQITLVVDPENTDVAPSFTGTPNAGTVGLAYSFAFSGITGSPAPTFAMSPQTVAGGITISAAGALSGTPTTSGSFPITVTASNGVAPNAVKQLTLQVAPANTDVPPGFTGTPTAGTQSSPYSFAFTGITGSPAPTFTMDPATVAGGITLGAAGTLSGTPTVAGSFPITVTAANGVAPAAVKQLTLEIAPVSSDVPPDFAGTPSAGMVNAAYSFAFTGITGSPAPTFTMDPATVAGGITISAAGVLSGTPTVAGSFPITVTAANGVSPDAVRQLTLEIAPENTGSAPDFSGTPGRASVGSAYSFAFTGITGSPAPTFTLGPATVAGGITISGDGVLSGTPTTAGSFPITVTASNGVAPDAVKTLTLVVDPKDQPPPPSCKQHKGHHHSNGWWVKWSIKHWVSVVWVWDHCPVPKPHHPPLTGWAWWRDHGGRNWHWGWSHDHDGKRH